MRFYTTYCCATCKYSVQRKAGQLLKCDFCNKRMVTATHRDRGISKAKQELQELEMENKDA